MAWGDGTLAEHVLMPASVLAPLTYGDMLANDWEIIGSVMYRPGALQKLAARVRSGLLDLGVVRVSSFARGELPAAMQQAARMRGLDCTALKIAG